MSEAFYFDEFQRHKAEGMHAYNRGDAEEASYSFLKAAENLLKLSQLSQGKLREVRFRNAQQLIDMAKSIRSKGIPKSKPHRKAKASETSQGPQEEESKASDWRIKEKPSVTFSDIAGLEDAKEQIRLKMIYPFTHPEKAARYGIKKGGGILLYGPPGTGKTMLGKAVARELDAPFYLIKPSTILSKWVGESEQNVAKLFDEARSQERAVIFIDEVEALVPARREMQSNVMQRLVPQILAELDGFEQRTGSLLFVGATNEPWEIDYAMLRPGRLDEKVYIGLPDVDSRRAILIHNLRGAPLAEAVDYDVLARQLEGYSGADIAYVCRKVRETVFQQSVEKNVDREITPDDFDAILARMGPSVEAKDLKRFDEFRREMAT
ncbi:MAG TPA: ATP-binding protein [Planctomycetota bacterium]|nr:ATP-binding protein [Planctomycetota bacterium]